MITKELIKRLRKIEIMTSRLANDQLAGEYHSVFKGRGMAFSEVRQYQHGDDVRFIDWNVSARFDDVFVKVFTEEREVTVLLLVDLSASQHFFSGDRSKLETAAEIAALLAFSAIKNQDRVGLLLFTDQVERFVPPKKGKAHVMRVITEILNATPQSPKTDLCQALGMVGRLLKRRAIIFVVSDFISPNYERELRLLASRHDVVPIQISDTNEAKLPDVGLALFEDPETGACVEVDTSDRNVQQAFALRQAQLKSARETMFRRLQLDFADIKTQQNYVKPLQQLFKRRRRRLRGGLA